MRLRVTLATATLAAALAVAAPAAATPVLILHGHRASWHDDPYLPAVELPPPGPGGRPPAGAPVGAGRARSATPAVTAARARRRRRRKPKRPPTLTSLSALLRAGAVAGPEYSTDVAIYNRAVSADRKLRGSRHAELAAVIANADAIAAAGGLDRDRLAAVFMTLQRNTQWWTSGPMPSPSTRIGFSGSELVWEYYPGQGIELQALGNFGKANGLWQAKHSTRLRALLDELLALAVNRGGATAWEYYFRFDGGRPPWVSAISQGTAAQALARASQLLGDASLAAAAKSAAAIFELPPPTGVRLDEPAGPYYLSYSFDPNGLVLNAFLQALIGLHDLAQITGDPTAASLYQSGDAEARVQVPLYDTGAWSLYQPGQEDMLDYHKLVTGFLHRLCQYTGAAPYCETESHFNTYLHTPPTIAAAPSTRVRAGRPARLTVTLDKISHVTLEIQRGARVVFRTSALVAHGTPALAWAKPLPGTYTLRFVATDLAGNRSETSGQLTVLAPKRKPRRRRH